MKKVLVVICCSFLLSGCISRMFQRDVSFYDFGEQIDVNSPVTLTVKHFSSAGVDIPQMLFRRNDVEIIKDDHNRWVTNPSALLAKSFRFTQLNRKMTQHYVLSGKLMTLEMNKESKKVSFAVNYQINNKKTGDVVISSSFAVSKPVDKGSGRAFADGVRSCVREFADHVVKSAGSLR